MDHSQPRFSASLKGEFEKVLEMLEPTSPEEMATGRGADLSADLPGALAILGQSLELSGYGVLLLLVEEIARTQDVTTHASPGPRREANQVLRTGLARLTRGVSPADLVSASRLPLEILNDLRALRGAPLLTESPLFDAGSDVGLFAGDDSPAGSRWTDTELRELGKGLRPYYQKGLVSWLRGDDGPGSLELMQVVLERLADIGADRPGGALWSVALGLVDALVVGAVSAGPAIRRLYGQLDRELKRLRDEGAAALRVASPPALLANLLFYLEGAEVCEPRPRRTRDNFGLGQRFEISSLSAAQRERTADEMRGDLDAVAQLLEADQSDDLGRQAQALSTLGLAADTLALLGRTSQRRLLVSLCTRVADARVPLMQMQGTQARTLAADLRDVLDLATDAARELSSADAHSGGFGPTGPTGLGGRARRRSGELVPHRLQHEFHHLRDVLRRIEHQAKPDAIAHARADPPGDIEAKPFAVDLATAQQTRTEPRMLDFAALAERLGGLSAGTTDRAPDGEVAPNLNADPDVDPEPYPQSDARPDFDEPSLDGSDLCGDTDATPESPEVADPLRQLEDEGIALDATLLENLSTVAGALNQTRAGAEDRVGGVRNGLESMGDTLRDLRSHLRGVELETQSRGAGAGPTPRTPMGAPTATQDAFAQDPFSGSALSDSALGNLGNRLEQLSSGLDTLQDMQDTISSLAGEAQSFLTRQAREHVGLRDELARAPGAEQVSGVVEGSGELLVVRVGDQQFALPLDRVAGVSRLESPLSPHRDGPLGTFPYAGHECRLHYLGELLHLGENREPEVDAVVVLAGEHDWIALLVDELCGRRQLETVELGPQLTGVELVRAAALNADDPPVLLLEPTALIRAGLT